MQHSNKAILIIAILVLAVIAWLSYLYLKPAPQQYHITFAAGITFQQMLKDIQDDPHLRHTLKNHDGKTIMAKVGHPDDQRTDEQPEGRFLPGVYSFGSGTTDIQILKKAYMAMQAQLGNAWEGRAANLPYQNPYQILIIASIIEKEAMADKERPIISGVIINRLAKNMLLQMDATVIYGLKKFNKKLSPADLKIDTPYNSYIHPGLPPTPIAIPSESSLQAAAHPDHNNYFYFVSKGNGTHQFSATEQEQEAAIKKYLH